MIKLIILPSEIAIRINPDLIVAYWNSEDIVGVSEMITINEDPGQSIKVKATAEEIDKLILRA